MTMLLNGPVPTRGENVQTYTDWARQPQPSPLMYSKRSHDVHPADRHIFSKRVFTVPATSRTVVTQRPKYIIRQNRTTSAPPPLVRNQYTQDRYGFTNAHFLPARGYIPPYQGYGNTHVTKRYITQPQYRQELIRPPPIQYVGPVSRPAPAPVQYVETGPVSRPAPAPVQYVETGPAPVQYIESVSTPSPPAQRIQHTSTGDTYHIKLNTNTMSYSKEKLGGSSSNFLESTTYRERTYTDPGEYSVNTRFSAYKPSVQQGTYYQTAQNEETPHDWTVVGGGSAGHTESYRVSGNWAGQETEVKTQTAEFYDNQNDDAILIRQESREPETDQIVQKRTYEEVVIVDYVDNTDTQNVPPLSISTPKFTEHEISPIDAVLHGESSGSSSSSSESDSGEHRRQRNPSS